jgi:hypothetical protein
VADYIKATNFAVKDALTTGDPNKVVKGTEIDTEFNNIASAVASKADSQSPTFTGTPLAPTAGAGTNTTQIATTAFVGSAITTAIGNINTGVVTFSGGTTGLTPNTATAGAVTLGGTLALTNGGTGGTTASAARSNLGVPSTTGANASGTWAIDITGTAANVSSISSSQVLNATASATAGGVGTYAWLTPVDTASTTWTRGSTVSGSSYLFCGLTVSGGNNVIPSRTGTPSGTWRALGPGERPFTGGQYVTGLFLRIS